MAEREQRTATNPEHHLRQQLDSLRAAGIEWLPGGPAPAVTPSTPVAAIPDRVVPAAVPPTLPLFGSTTSPTASAAPVASDGQLLKELNLLIERVVGCIRCPELAAKRTQTVFGVGPIDAPLCFVGEAPGENEDLRGEPFVGAAGQLLNRIIAACGMKREDVYICNIIKCRPPGNRLPLADEAGNCREYLDRQLELIRPRFLCALGACAAQNLLGSKLSIGRLRGRFHDYRGVPVLCTYHPAYLLRSPEKKKDVWEDMKKLLARMGRTVPGQR